MDTLDEIIIIDKETIPHDHLNKPLINIGYNKENIIWCNNISAAMIDTSKVAVILVSISLLHDEPTDVLPNIVHQFPSVPLIVIISEDDIDVVPKLLELGANDYLVKEDINKSSVAKAIQYAIGQKNNASNYDRFFLHNPLAMVIFNKSTRKILAVNDAAVRQYGYSKEEFRNLTTLDIRPPEDIPLIIEHLESSSEQYYDAGRWRHQKKDGTIFWVRVYAHTIDFEGGKARMIVVVNINDKVKAEKESQRRAKQVENILSSITDAFFTIDKDNVFTYVNKEFEHIIKRSAQELIGTNIWEAFPEAVPLKFFPEYQRATEHRVSVQFEEFLPSLELWLSVKAYPTDDGLAVYFTDITERKAIQNKLTIDEQNLRAIINNTRDVIWSIDREYKILSGNNAFWEQVFLLTGKRPDEVAEGDFNKELFNTWAEYFDRAFLGETFKIVLEQHTEHGTFYVETSFNPIINDSEVIGISCFSRDISEEKRLQKKIITDEQNLRAMIDNTDDMVWSVDEEMKLIAANQVYLNVYSARTNRSLHAGDPVLLEIFGKDRLEEWRDIYLRGLAGERFTIEQDRTFGNEVKHTETRFNPIYATNGAVIGVSCFRRDMTELHNYLRKIEAQNEKLKKIAWVQSHQVRNHVATILGLASLLTLPEDVSGDNRIIIEGIKTSSTDLDNVIKDINLQAKQLE